MYKVIEYSLMKNTNLMTLKQATKKAKNNGYLYAIYNGEIYNIDIVKNPIYIGICNSDYYIKDDCICRIDTFTNKTIMLCRLLKTANFKNVLVINYYSEYSIIYVDKNSNDYLLIQPFLQDKYITTTYDYFSEYDTANLEDGKIYKNVESFINAIHDDKNAYSKIIKLNEILDKFKEIIKPLIK